MTHIPTSILRDTLRQHHPDDSGEIGAALLDTFFPSFRSLHDQAASLAEQGIHRIISGKSHQFGSRCRERRYAGDTSLDRGRYFAILDPSTIDPNCNTLMAELFSYASPSQQDLPVCLDSKYDEEQLAGLGLGQSSETEDILYFVVEPTVLRKVCGIEMDSGDGNVVVGVKIRKQTAQIDKVIDLRQPATSEWFTQHFCALEMQGESEVTHRVRFRKYWKPQNFYELLPTLLDPTLGGGTPFLQGIGAWLRSHDVAGLVFPSSRIDSGVNNTANDMVSWGWNYVDYRGSNETPWEHYFGQLPAWIKPEDIHANIVVHPGSGSWKTEGVTAARIARFQHDRMGFLEEEAIRQPPPKNTHADPIEELRHQLAAGSVTLADLIEELPSKFRENLASESDRSPEPELTVGSLIALKTTPVEDSYFEESVVWTGSWFVHQWGSCDAEIYLHCPACKHSQMWPYLRAAIPPMCRKCGFHNSSPNDSEGIQERIRIQHDAYMKIKTRPMDEPAQEEENDGWALRASGLLEKPSPSDRIEALVRCPECGWESSYLPRDEYEPRCCPECKSASDSEEQSESGPSDCP